MNLLQKITDLVISVDTWATNLSPVSLGNKLMWFGFVEGWSVYLYINRVTLYGWWHYALVVFIVPMMAWLALQLFKSLVRYLVEKYFPGLNKYFSRKQDENEHR